MNEEIWKKYRAKITIDPNMRDYSKDPTIIKRSQEAIAFLKKNGLPKDLVELSEAKARKRKKASA